MSVKELGHRHACVQYAGSISRRKRGGVRREQRDKSHGRNGAPLPKAMRKDARTGPRYRGGAFRLEEEAPLPNPWAQRETAALSGGRQAHRGASKE